MTLPLVRRGLVHHWRVNAAVVLGVAAAVAVLGGALVVGESVRASLRDLALRRLGGVETAVRAGRMVREDLASDLGRASGASTAPIIAATGIVTEESGGRRASRVRVYGVDDRYWTLQGAVARGPQGRDALLGEALAAELGAAPGATLLVTLEKPPAIPAASLFGRRDDLVRTMRVTAAGTVPAADGGELSLDLGQQEVRTVFVPLALLQRTFEQPGRVDTVLVAEGADPARVGSDLRSAAALEDLGLRVRPVADGIAVESASGLVDDATARVARETAAESRRPAAGVLTYLANAIRANGREVPYSVVAAVDDALLAGLAASPYAASDAIVLNEWTARELGAKPGDRVTLDYFLWREEGRMETARAEFVVSGVTPMAGLAADRDLVPEYPGITTSERLADWDPPFPLDLGRVRPADENYWTRYRATPKAFVALATGQRLWGHRLGNVTSVRVAGADASAFADAFRRKLDPLALGLAVDPLRARALESARGATDFGEYFTYFSFFLVVSALLLAVLFFRLGLERRAAELGLLRAVGFTPSRLRRVHLAEAAVLAIAGAALGAAGAVAWAGLLVDALRTRWIGAVGTSALTVHASAPPIVIAAAVVGAVALAASAWTLRELGRVSPRALLAGDVRPRASTRSPGWTPPAVLLAAALALAAITALQVVPAVAGFFGSALFLLAAALAATRVLLAAGAPDDVPGGWAGIARLGWRGARHRPGRSLASIALVAFATFVVVSVGAFRRDTADTAGAGGYSLIAESIAPVHHDLGTREGRLAAGLDGDWRARRVARFHVKDGDDASCLNLYRPTEPRVIAPERSFLEAGGLRFQSSLAQTEAETANPWRLLAGKDDPTAPVPVIADAASMQYVLHKRLGDEVTLERPGAPPVRLRLVGALADSIFQSELVMGEDAFKRLFPDRDGYRLLLVDAAPSDEGAITGALESAFADEGMDVVSARDRLAAFHRVENTYLSTFQALGGLGLLLGTVGLATLLFRNALERRREIALLRAIGYRPGQVSAMLVAENAALLVFGVGAGIVAALAAVVPALQRSGGAVPWAALIAVAGAVVAAGLVTSAIAAAVVRRAPLIPALRSE